MAWLGYWELWVDSDYSPPLFSEFLTLSSFQRQFLVVSSTFSLYIDILLERSSTVYVWKQICGCRQFILYTIAEKLSAMHVQTHQHRGRRGITVHLQLKILSVDRKGAEGHGKCRQAIHIKRQKFNSKYTRKKGYEIHLIQVKDVSLLLFIYGSAQKCTVLCHIKIKLVQIAQGAGMWNQNWHEEWSRMS